MTHYDEELKQLYEQVSRKRRLENIISELTVQQDELLSKAEKLNQIRIKEDKDVKRLEGHGLASLFYGFLGTKEERLTKERQEAYAATLKYDTALKELKEVQYNLTQSSSELEGLLDCDRRYASLLEEKSKSIKASGMPQAEEILKLEELISYSENQKREINEALTAGEKAHAITSSILKSLDSAEGWATMDIISDGFIFDMAKHNHLNEAQTLIEELQIQLRSFKTELADITIDTDLQVNIDGFLKFADYFFDDIFSDFAVMNRIKDSKARILDTQKQIEQVFEKLDYMISETEKKQQADIDKRDELIVKTQL